MPGEPNTNTPDDTDDVNSTDSGNQEIVMDDVEAKAGFLDDRDPDFPLSYCGPFAAWKDIHDH